MNTPHTSVLLQETIEGLDLQPGFVVVDATVGAGGHSLLMSEQIGPTGLVIGFDADKNALQLASEKLATGPAKFIPIESNFRHLATKLEEIGIGSVDAVLFDLGVSSMQLDSGKRGFSFRFNEPLLMTLKTTPTADDLTALDLVATLEAKDLAIILKNYGEEQFADKISSAIVEARRTAPIDTTFRLIEVIESAVPNWYKKRRLHPATKTFQALRIATNDELGALTEGLESAWGMLKTGGRLAVISFHSLEAKIVKNFYKDKKTSGLGEIISKKVIRPSRTEIVENKRSRSASLRIIKKLSDR